MISISSSVHGQSHRQTNTQDRKFLRSAILLLCIAVSFTRPSSGQNILADLTGIVTDASGAIVPNATVTATDAGTQLTRVVQTNAEGRYTLSSLQPGTYNLDVVATGFKKQTITGISLLAGGAVIGNATLQVGETTETVNVTADAAGLQTDNSTVASTIDQQAAADLPLNGRNIFNLVTVQAGVNAGGPTSVGSGTRSGDRRGNSSISANGQFELYNNFILDGLDNTDRFQGFAPVRTNPDAIAEVRIETNLYAPELGRTAGAVVEIFTKSGTNNFHGEAYEFLRNSVTDAQNYFALSTLPKAPYRQNQYGGTFGGPIFKNKTFFFADYEHLKLADGTTTTSTTTVPTQYEHDHPGDFTDRGGIVVPANLVDPTGIAYFKLFPSPTSSAVSSNYTSAPLKIQSQDTYDIRADQNFNARNLFFARFSSSSTTTQTPGNLPVVNGVQAGGTGNGFPGPGLQSSKNVQLNYTHVFSPSLLGESRLGYTLFRNKALPLNYGTNYNDAGQQYAIPGANAGIGNSGLAGVTVTGYSLVGDYPFLPNIVNENTYQGNSAVTYSHGSHTFKAGLGFIYREAANLQNSAGKGSFSFNRGANGITDLTQLIEGGPYQLSRSTSLIVPTYLIAEPSIFGQDTWHTSRFLTLTFGARYDVFTAPKERHDFISNLNLSTGTLVTGGTGGISTRYGNFAPRVGFSFSPDTKTVLRGGFGLSYFATDVGNAIFLNNPPYSYATGTIVPTTPLSQGIAVPTFGSTTNLSGALQAKAFNYRTGYIEQYNLFVQHEFAGYIETLGYVGDVGRHLVQAPANIDIGLPSGSATPNPRPYAALLPNVNTIGYTGDGSVSSYNALQGIIARSFKSGFNFNANYTWAHALDDSFDTGITNASAFGQVPTAIRSVDYGNSDVDIRHRIAATGSYALPFANGSVGVKRAALQGWQLNTVTYWQTGVPFTVTSAITHIGIPTLTSDRPNILGAPGGPRGIPAFLNPAQFYAQPVGTLGNEGRNVFHGPHIRRSDLSLFKTFDVYEALKLQFRAEVFNLSNTPTFSIPNTTITGYTTVNGASTATNAGNFGSITGVNPGVGSRVYQFSLKLTF